MSDLTEFLLNKLDKLDEKLDDIKVQQIETKNALISHEDRDKLIHDDVKAMGSQVDTQCKLLAEYNASLKEHMRRTEMLENKVEPLHVEFTDKQAARGRRHMRYKKWAKIAAIVTTVIGIIAGIAQIISVIK